MVVAGEFVADLDRDEAPGGGGQGVYVFGGGCVVKDGEHGPPVEWWRGHVAIAKGGEVDGGGCITPVAGRPVCRRRKNGGGGGFVLPTGGIQPGGGVRDIFPSIIKPLAVGGPHNDELGEDLRQFAVEALTLP